MYGQDYHYFNLFDSTHLCWLAIFALALVASVLVFKRLNQLGRRHFILLLTILMLLDELLKYVVTGLTGQFQVQYLPFHLCSVNIFVCLWYTIRPNRVAANILYCLCIPGALIALLMPTWTAQPMWNIMAIHSESIHMMLCIYPLLLFVDGFRPDYKALPRVTLFLVVACIPAVLLNTIFGTNFMFLNGTSGNALLQIFVDILGERLYVLGILALLLLIWALMYLPWILLGKRKAKT